MRLKSRLNTPVQRHRMTFLLVLCASFTSGCQRSNKQVASALVYFDNGSPEQVISALDDASAIARKGDQDAIAIDRAIATAMAGDVAESERLLRITRDRLEFLEQKDIREQTKSLLSDDKAVAWTGREFERRMVDNLLILTSLLGNHQDAFAFATQAIQQVTAETPDAIKASSSNPIISVGHAAPSSGQPTVAPEARQAANALTAYLHAAVHSESAMDADLTNRSLRLVSYWNGNRTPQQQAATIPIGTNSQAGHGVVHVVTFVGRITDWQAVRAEPTSAALLIADQILSAVGDHTLPPTIAPVMIAKPAVDISRQPFTTAATAVGQAMPTAVSRTLVDLNATAMASYEHDRDDQIARAVVRRVVKKGAVYAAKDQIAVSNGTAADLLLTVGGIAWEAMEKADTRHLNLLPERIETLQVELPEGSHQLQISATSPQGTQLAKSVNRIDVEVHNGRNTFVLCFRNGSRFTRVVAESFATNNAAN